MLGIFNSFQRLDFEYRDRRNESINAVHYFFGLVDLSYSF